MYWSYPGERLPRSLTEGTGGAADRGEAETTDGPMAVLHYKLDGGDWPVVAMFHDGPGIRTATHAFQYSRDKKSPYAKWSFDSAEWPGPLKKAVDRRGETRTCEEEHECRRALLERVEEQHRRDGHDTKQRERIHPSSVAEACHVLRFGPAA